MLDLIIIGAGPAGMSACLYASRAGLDVLILDGSAPGGKLNVTAQIENYPGLKPTPGPEIAFTMYESAMSFGAKIMVIIKKSLLPNKPIKQNMF